MKLLKTKAAAITVISTLSLSAAWAQPVRGLYALHTGADSGCPGLDWHVTIEQNNSLDGFVAWDRGQHMARLVGTIANNGSFTLAAKEVGGEGRTATVKGTAAGSSINISIDGSGTACDGKYLSVPRAVGALGGGG